MIALFALIFAVAGFFVACASTASAHRSAKAAETSATTSVTMAASNKTMARTSETSAKAAEDSATSARESLELVRAAERDRLHPKIDVWLEKDDKGPFFGGMVVVHLKSDRHLTELKIERRFIADTRASGWVDFLRTSNNTWSELDQDEQGDITIRGVRKGREYSWTLARRNRGTDLAMLGVTLTATMDGHEPWVWDMQTEAIRTGR